MPMQSHFRLCTLLAILAGFGLRLYHLGTESLWYDETVSVALAQKAIPELIHHTAGDIHPPGYYLLLHGWQALTHPTPAFGLEFLYAWPSLWCGVLVLVLLFVIGRTLLNVQVALLALGLAAVNPYHLWYSQEVRMYTMGALLGLVCLWALLKWWQSEGKLSRYRWLLVYIVAGVAGLYTLYYFLFALIALNSIVLWLWLRQRPPVGRAFGAWLLAQGALLLLWAPWLPIFWHQITDPPVPPWRTPWTTGSQFLAALTESASALLSGQSAPAPASWLWLLMFCAVMVIVFYGYTNINSEKATLFHDRLPRFSLQVSYLILGAYVLIPLVVIMVITQWGTPLYHVRYLFTYAPPLLLLLAAAIATVYRRQRVLGSMVLVAILLLNGWSLYQFWFTPPFRTDDHRGAVAQIAAAWRPGDAILVNAGWVYTALTTYWPIDLVGVDAAAPPLAHLVRLADDHILGQQKSQAEPSPLAAPLLVRTGSVDGASSLGWGDPTSDFFAMSAAATTDALATLAQQANRFWHYRLYDTVNDPKGLIRTWLAEHNTLLAEAPISGRDYLRLQLYQNAQIPTATVAWTPLLLPPTKFTGELQLQQAAVITSTVAAGTYLYAQLRWQPPVERAQLPAMLSFSLRLYTEDGHLLAQADETPLLPVATWSASYIYTMALPIPIATPPGAHRLVLIVYDQRSGIPLAVQGSDTQPQALPLGPLQIAPAVHAPVVTSSLASFDYIDLVRARLSSAHVAPGAALDIELVWRPRKNAYRDTYLAQLTLQDATGQDFGQWAAALGGWHYPSGVWPPLIPVRDWRALAIPPTTPPGHYTLVLQVQRDSDKQTIPARQGWWSSVDTLVVGDIEVLSK